MKQFAGLLFSQAFFITPGKAKETSGLLLPQFCAQRLTAAACKEGMHEIVSADHSASAA